MADKDDIKDGKTFYEDVPANNEPFFLRGSGALDWGMQNRLSRIFNPKTGRTVMLAFDHGYFQGPTTGIESLDVNIVLDRLAHLFDGGDVHVRLQQRLADLLEHVVHHGLVCRERDAVTKEV